MGIAMGPQHFLDKACCLRLHSTHFPYACACPVHFSAFWMLIWQQQTFVLYTGEMRGRVYNMELVGKMACSRSNLVLSNHDVSYDGDYTT